MNTDMSHLNDVRYGYFDAMRGFSMVLIVFWHVMLYSGFTGGINPFFCSFPLPTFFFVSGFFAYKPIEYWSRHLVIDIVTKKIKTQVIGAFIFFSVYLILIRHRIPGKEIFFNQEEYWFTLMLIRIFIAYLVIVLIAKAMHNNNRALWIILSAFAILSIFIHSYYNYFIPLRPSFLYQIFVHTNLRMFFYYVPYFTLGLMSRSNIGKFERIISHDAVKIFVFISIVTIWCMTFMGRLPMVDSEIGHGYSPLAYPLGLLTLTLVCQFFYNIKRVFDRDSSFSKVTRFIGRRTLDIYFIHYFFLPNLFFLVPYFTSGNTVMLQLTIGFTVSFIIIGLSLFVGQVIRMSPTLAEWLLGVKKKRL